jgi:hypothetical protein
MLIASAAGLWMYQRWHDLGCGKITSPGSRRSRES